MPQAKTGRTGVAHGHPLPFHRKARTDGTATEPGWQAEFTVPRSPLRGLAFPGIVPAADGGCWATFPGTVGTLDIVRLGPDGGLAWSRSVELPEDTFVGSYPYTSYAAAGTSSDEVLLALRSTDGRRGEGEPLDLAFVALAADGRRVEARRLGNEADAFLRNVRALPDGFASLDFDAALRWDGKEPRLARSDGSLPPLPERCVTTGWGGPVERAFTGFRLLDAAASVARTQAYAGGPDPGRRGMRGSDFPLGIRSVASAGAQAILMAAEGRLGALPVGAGIVSLSTGPWPKGLVTLGEVRLPAPPVNGSAWKRVAGSVKLDAKLNGGGVTAVTVTPGLSVERNPAGVRLLPYEAVE